MVLIAQQKDRGRGMTSTNGPFSDDTMILTQTPTTEQPRSSTTALAKARLLQSRAVDLRESLIGYPALRNQATAIMIRAAQLARDLDSQVGAALQPIPSLTAREATK